MSVIEDESETTGEKPGYVVSPFGVPNCPPGAVSGALFNGCSDPFGLGQTVDPDFYDVQFTFPPKQDIESYGFVLDLNWDLGRHTFVSQTAWDSAERTLHHAPDWNFNGIARYEHPLGNGRLGLQLDGWWLDDQYFTVENVPSLQESSHGLLNTRASYSFMDDRVEVALFVKNLTDEKCIVTGFDSASSGFGAHISVLNQPRTWGGQVIFRYE